MARMPSLRAQVATVLAALGLALGPAAAALAAGDEASIAHVESTDQGLQILVSVPADARVDLDQVSVTVDGETADSSAELATSTTAVRRTAVLAIDTSNSMRGERFAAAKAAAGEFLDSVPDDVYVGIVTFAGDVATALPPTQDRDRARSALDALSLTKKTRLYDGVLQAVDAAGGVGQRTILVLSDGADTSSTTLTEATDAVSDADVLVDVVAVEQTGTAAAALDDLAAAGGGQVIPADTDALRTAFNAEAGVLARQVLVTAQVPATVTKTQATLDVSLPGSTGTLTAEAFSTVQEGAKAAPVASRETGWAPPSWVLYAGPGALGVGLVVLLVMLVPRREAPLTAAERITRYTEAQGGHAQDAGPRMDTDQALASAKETAAGVLRRNQGLDARISHRLEASGSELKPAEWLLTHGAIFFVSGLLGIALGSGNLFIGLIFLVAGALGPWIYLGFRVSRRRKAFNRGLPDTLQLMSGSLSAGLSLAQSVDTIVREGPDPICDEFRRVLVETRLGVTLEDALEGVGERFDSKDFEWVVMAIKIQRKVGGNLAELLDTVAATMREREYIRRQVAALAAEGKLSAWVLGLLPPLFMLYLLVANHDYVIVMFQEPVGWLMLIGAGTLLSVGVLWMSRLVKVDV